MTYIKSVHGQNIKGRSFHHQLERKTAICGPNMAGKTAIADCIRLALAGKIPEVGEKAGAAFAFSSGASMSVAVELENGDIIKRTLSQSNGSVKTVPAKADPQYVCSLLDSEAWFRLTERERIDYVFRNVRMPADKTPSGIIASLQRLTFGENHSEAIEEAKAKVIGDIAKILRDIEETGETIADAILDAEDVLTQDFTLWNRRATDSEGAIRTIAELKIRENECSAETIADIQSKLKAAEAALAKAHQDMGQLDAQNRIANGVVARRERIEAELKTPKPEPLPAMPFKASMDIDQVRSSLRHANETLEKNPKPHRNEVEQARETYNAKAKIVTNFAAEVKSLEVSIDEKQAEIADVQSMGLCPACTKKLSAGALEQIEKKRAVLAQRTQALESAEETKEKAFATLRRLETAYEGGTEVERNKSNLEQSIRAHESDVANYERGLEQKKENDAAKLKLWEEQQRNLRAELDRLETVNHTTADEMRGAKQMLDDATRDVAEGRQRLRAAEQLAQDIKREAQASDTALEAVARRDVIKAVKAKLVELKGELVASAFGSLLEVANKITHNVLPKPLIYNDETSEVGMLKKTGFVSHKTFSGTEKVVAYIAIATALSAKCPLRVPIIDEFARLTTRLQRQIATNLSNAIDEGHIDQAIVIIPSEGPVSLTWHTINLEAE